MYLPGYLEVLSRGCSFLCSSNFRDWKVHANTNLIVEQSLLQSSSDIELLDIITYDNVIEINFVKYFLTWNICNNNSIMIVVIKWVNYSVYPALTLWYWWQFQKSNGTARLQLKHRKSFQLKLKKLLLQIGQFYKYVLHTIFWSYITDMLISLISANVILSSSQLFHYKGLRITDLGESFDEIFRYL